MQTQEPRTDRIVRAREIKEITGLTPSALDRAVKSGRFPKPFRLIDDERSRAIGWSWLEIQAWIQSRVEAPRLDAGEGDLG